MSKKEKKRKKKKTILYIRMSISNDVIFHPATLLKHTGVHITLQRHLQPCHHGKPPLHNNRCSSVHTSSARLVLCNPKTL